MQLLKLTLIVFLCTAFLSFNGDTLAASKGAKAGKSSQHRGHKAYGRSKGKAKAGAGDVWVRIRQGIRIPRPSPAPESFGVLPAVSLNKSSAFAAKTTDGLKAADELGRLNTVISPNKNPMDEPTLKDKMRVRQFLNAEKSGKSNIESNTQEKYTPLGKLRFAKKDPSSAGPDDLSKKLHFITKDKPTLTQDDSAFKSASVQRIRTRLGLHPELYKNGKIPFEETKATKTAQGKKSVTVLKPRAQNADLSKCADLNKIEVISLAQQGVLASSYAQMVEECRNKLNDNVARVNKHISGYGRGFLYGASERARPYLYHIVDALSKYGLPLDLALLPIVESAYQPTALSPMDAAGIWQFIPSTGQEYGMEQNDAYDARLDITASTHAAIRFLSGLNAHFRGDWLLSLAAYNCGQGTVDAAIARNQAEGLDTDFWSLDLPAETQEYVPRLLAVSAIFSNPGGYGLKLRPVKNEAYFIKVNIDREADIKQLANKDLSKVAKLADFDPDQFRLLNTAYLKSTLPEGKPFTLLMPISNANLLHQSLAFMAKAYQKDKNQELTALSELGFLSSAPIVPKITPPLLSLSINNDGGHLPIANMQPRQFATKPKPKVEIAGTKPIIDKDWTLHYLDKGESLKVVAEAHGTTEEMLRIANKLKNRQSVTFGQRLLVPLKQIATTSTTKEHVSVLFNKI